MSIKVISKVMYNVQTIIGQSSDDKPTNCDPGSTFEEYDTGNKFMFDGTTWWPREDNISDFTFQGAATSAGNGNVLTISKPVDLEIEIYGTATSSTLVFEMRGKGSAWIPLIGDKEGDPSFTIASQTTGINECWGIDVPSTATQIRMRIASISGGNLTVVGKVMS